MHQIHQRAKPRKGILRRLINNMPQITKLEGIDSGTLRFEATMRDYEKAGYGRDGRDG